jgi:hypothetical protein
VDLTQHPKAGTGVLGFALKAAFLSSLALGRKSNLKQLKDRHRGKLGFKI